MMDSSSSSYSPRNEVRFSESKTQWKFHPYYPGKNSLIHGGKQTKKSDSKISQNEIMKIPNFKTKKSPESPKSCMKSSRRLTFEDDEPSSSPSPKKKSTKKAVVIKSPGNIPGESAEEKAERVAELQFQFELTQHYEQATPPPNCTSNGSHFCYENEKKKPPPSPPPPPRPSDDEDDDDTSMIDITKIDPTDPLLIEIATRFVNDIIEQARIEAEKRQKAETAATRIQNTAREIVARITPQYRRATTNISTTVSKWFSNAKSLLKS